MIDPFNHFSGLAAKGRDPIQSAVYPKSRCGYVVDVLVVIAECDVPVMNLLRWNDPYRVYIANASEPKRTAVVVFVSYVSD